MATYLQLGHESWNLIGDPDIGEFAGAVLSPVNDGPLNVEERLTRAGAARSGLELILDPQLYNPSTDRGCLNQWSYYPSDFATADRSDTAWWVARSVALIQDAVRLGLDAVCSPAYISRNYDGGYYRHIVEIGDETKAIADANQIDTLLTAIIPIRTLEQPERAYEIASILSGSRCDRLYLTFLCEETPQREPFKDGVALATAVHLLRLLSNQMRVHTAFCSHDLVMWKFAGATDVSTGKFLNVRRFSPSRWKEEENGGRNTSYWNEGPLLTLLRDQDVLRLDQIGWFDSETFADNPASARIMESLRSGSGEPWLAHSWRQYLRWAVNSERQWRDPAAALNAIEASDQKWGELESRRFRFADRFNSGDHSRTWLNAVDDGAAR